MGHFINGFLALHEPLIEASRTLSGSVVCPLNQGFSFLPFHPKFAFMDEPAFASLAVDRLMEPMADWAQRQSLRFPIAYIETEYFGGIGGQSSIFWNGGAITLGPIRTDDSVILSNGAINIVARSLGVSKEFSVDEFAALGLGRYRDNDDWIASQ